MKIIYLKEIENCNTNIAFLKEEANQIRLSMIFFVFFLMKTMEKIMCNGF